MWQICPSTYRMIIQPRICRNDVDLFADGHSHLLLKYVSRKWDPQAMATDGFTIPWQNFCRPLVHTPWNLINVCLRKPLQNSVPATVVVPFWPRAVWFPLLQQMSKFPTVVRAKRARINDISALALAVDISRLEAIRLGYLKRKYPTTRRKPQKYSCLASRPIRAPSRFHAKAHDLFIAWFFRYCVDVALRPPTWLTFRWLHIAPAIVSTPSEFFFQVRSCNFTWIAML
jgi:hypothetical protein